MLVKYSCGCVGLKSTDAKKTTIFRICDNTSHLADGEYCISTRDRREKSLEDVDPITEDEIFSTLSNLVGDGQNLREIQNLLGIKRVVPRDIQVYHKPGS
jgi:hypothetical protein